MSSKKNLCTLIKLFNKHKHNALLFYSKSLKNFSIIFFLVIIIKRWEFTTLIFIAQKKLINVFRLKCKKKKSYQQLSFFFIILKWHISVGGFFLLFFLFAANMLCTLLFFKCDIAENKLILSFCWLFF